jgi:UDP-glucose 4-epimerase
MEKMKILVSGVAGFLGSHLSERLIAEGHYVIGIDNMVGGYLDNVPEGVQFHDVDCLDNEKVKELMQGVELVYHLASACHEGLSHFSPYYYSMNTFETTMSMISAALANNVKRFVLCSSAARYGEIEAPFREDMLPKPQDPYGISKYASDLALADLCDTHGMEYSIIVPHNIIGTRQKYDDPYRNVVSIMINLMLQGRPPIIYGDGEQERSFSFVSDVVDPFIKVGFDPEANGEIFNVGPDQSTMTINQLAKTLADIIGYTGEFQYVPIRPKEVRVVHASADKARAILGYEAKKDIREGLQEMVDWVRERGTKPFDYHLPIELPDSPILPITWKERLF